MRQRTKRTRFGLGVLLALSLSAVSPRAAATRPLISVGEVSARVAGADAATESELRSLVLRELGRLRLDQMRRADTYVFSASLVRLDARASRDGARATCVVSAILRRARSGAIVAMMQGRGAAEDAGAALESVRAEALEAAVRGAVRRVPEAF